MIDRLLPYPETRESGVPGVGMVPAHWPVLRAKHLFREVDERSTTGHEELLSVSHKTGVTPRSQKNVTMFMAESHVGYKVCRPDDIAINTMWAWMAALGVSGDHGIVSPAYGVYRPLRGTQFARRYLDELLRTPAYRGEYVVRSTGITSSRLRLYPDQFLQVPLLAPPADEQALIVRFLDHADRRIRRLIAAKQRMIKLLEEQKRSVVDVLVRGIGRSGAWRSSGIDWLGEIPEAWRVARLKTVVGSVTSGSRGWSDFAADTGPLFVRIANLSRSSLGLRFEDVVRVELPGSTRAEAERARLRADDILLSITAFIGSVGVVPAGLGEAYISQHVACCRPRPGAVVPRWAGYVLLSSIGQTHGQLAMNGGTKQGLSLDDVRNYVLVLPSLPEQQALVATIERQTAELDRAIAREADHIPLLREYRTRLISDVVTGKLDVRAAAATLPTEAEPIEPLDDTEPDDVDDLDDALPEEAAG